MLKASVELLGSSGGQSFLIRRFDREGFKAPFHFHPEYELTLIISGKGKRYVGTHIGAFNSGDLVLLGPDLPHCWKTDDSDAASVVIQFNRNFPGEDFFHKQELSLIDRLLRSAIHGLSFPVELSTSMQDSFIKLSEGKDMFKNLIAFLEILQQLARVDNPTILSGSNIVRKSYSEQEKINNVFGYIIENFNKEIHLTDAAAIANMTTNAFCKYFKKVTRQTFLEMVIAYRLDHSVKLLLRSEKPVAEICYDSGFGDVSHFYKAFKIKYGLSPLNYRKRFLDKN